MGPESRQPTVLLVSRPSVDGYPPVLYQIQLLTEAGWAVTVADGSSPRQGGAPIVATGRRYGLGATGSSAFVGRALAVVRFVVGVRRIVKSAKPDWVAAYDPDSAWALGSLPRRLGMLLLWHFHELPEVNKSNGTESSRVRYVHRHAQLPNLVVFPDRERGNLFARRSGLDPTGIHVVANCPRPIKSIPSGHSLREKLSHRSERSSGIVMYQGSVGRDHGLDVAVDSIPQWPGASRFVVKGLAAPAYVRSLRQKAEALGVMDRLRFLEYSPGLEDLAGADVAWTLLEPTTDNWKYAALASNKRFESMALGLPQITDRNCGVPELVEDTRCGLCVPHDSVAAVAAAMRTLLSDEGLRREMGENGRRLHLARYNYDHQFRPVLAQLRAMANRRMGTMDPES